MLLLEILRNKPDYKKNDEIIRDLTARSIEFTPRMSVQSTGIVSEDLAMRMDLVSKVYFKNSNKMDILLKFNGISNPFSLDEGDIVLIPNEDDMKSALLPKTGKDNATNKEELITKFFDPDRMSKKDKKRLDYLKEKSANLANGSETNLPPNFAEPGGKELQVIDGLVVFGADTVQKDNCPDPLSKARAKSKILEKKIFKNSK